MQVQTYIEFNEETEFVLLVSLFTRVFAKKTYIYEDEYNEEFSNLGIDSGRCGMSRYTIIMRCTHTGSQRRDRYMAH